MMVVICYDVETKSKAGRRRLRRIAKACEDFGQRVNNSVFECKVDPTQWKHLQLILLDEMDPEFDSMRFYYLGKNYERRIEVHGNKNPPDLSKPLIF